MRKAFGYCRVSREKQRKKFGLKAQERAIRIFALNNKIKLLGLYFEVASGRKNNRPILKNITACAREANAEILVFTMDRFSRNGAFSLHHIEYGPELTLVSHPTADKFTKQVLAIIAEKESADIGTRTKGGLYETKQKGTRLGNANPQTRRTKQKAWKKFVKRLRPIIRRYWKKGHSTVRKLTDALNRDGIKTFRRRSRWHISTVHKILKELNYKLQT